MLPRHTQRAQKNGAGLKRARSPPRRDSHSVFAFSAADGAYLNSELREGERERERERVMPLGRSDADRGLDLLWEFHREAQDEAERAAYAEAISSLHSYLTDLLPASQPTLRARAGRDGFVDVHPRQEAPARSVEIRCREGERLGLFIDYVSVSKLGGGGGVSPVVVSLVRPGSAAEREGSLSRGDQLLEVDGRPLAHVSLERARYD